ncbi:MAG: phosphoribosylformylglycinamidine synthase subunit PurQ [Desulfobacteraceae bacterium]|nr:MAG: phosphoribosylformylglycinamidine synthase subunit PurQ [Desulfobacteraceae bacterium]
MKTVKALVLTGYGLNCDYETDFSLKLAGADSERVHINELISSGKNGARVTLDNYHILVLGGGFSWADDHGAGVVMASKLKYNIGEEIEEFIRKGKLIIGICNGFQALVNLGLLPGFDDDYHSRKVALTYNDSGNFVDRWVTLRTQEDSICIFTRGISTLELPVRHGEGKFYAKKNIIDRLIEKKQVVIRYSDEQGRPAQGKWPFNPNGSLYDIAGVCDSTGRIFGIMPHPEAYNHYTNHPDWTRKREELARMGKEIEKEEGEGITIFRNAVQYIQENLDL